MRIGLFVVGGLVIICLSCVHVNNKGVCRMHPSPNFNERKHPVSLLVLHYTVIPTCEEALLPFSAIGIQRRLQKAQRILSVG